MNILIIGGGFVGVGTTTPASTFAVQGVNSVTGPAPMAFSVYGGVSGNGSNGGGVYIKGGDGATGNGGGLTVVGGNSNDGVGGALSFTAGSALDLQLVTLVVRELLH